MGRGAGERGAVWGGPPGGQASPGTPAPADPALPRGAPASDLFSPDVVSFSRLRLVLPPATRRVPRSAGRQPRRLRRPSSATPGPVNYSPRHSMTSIDPACGSGRRVSNRLPSGFARGKLSVSMALCDHAEERRSTSRRDVGGAGRRAPPYRWRPTWKLDSQECPNRRTTSTQQTAFSAPSPSRGWVASRRGALGSAWTTCPGTASRLRGRARRPCRPFAVGAARFREVSEVDLNQVSNFALPPLRRESGTFRTRGELEVKFLEQTEVDASVLFAQSPRLALPSSPLLGCRRRGSIRHLPGFLLLGIRQERGEHGRISRHPPPMVMATRGRQRTPRAASRATYSGNACAGESARAGAWLPLRTAVRAPAGVWASTSPTSPPTSQCRTAPPSRSGSWVGRATSADRRCCRRPRSTLDRALRRAGRYRLQDGRFAPSGVCCRHDVASSARGQATVEACWPRKSRAYAP